MLKYLEDSEALKVSTREMKEQLLSLNEPSVKIVRIARQARREKSKKHVPDVQQTRSERDPSRKYGEMGGAFETGDCVGEVMPGTQERS